MIRDHYQVLGVSRYASADELKKAYKKLAKEFHPDKHQGNSYYEEQFKLINEAYRTLSDPAKRNAYDLRLMYEQNARQHTTPSSTKTSTTTGQKQRTNSKNERPRTTAKKPSQKLYYTFFSLFFLAFLGLCVWFYGFMNGYTSRLHVTEAKRLMKEGNYRDAYLSSLEATSFDEKNAEAQYLKGVLLLRNMAKYDVAEYCFTNAIAASDTFFHAAYFERAKVLTKLKKFPSAINDLEALSKNPPVADSVYWYQAEIYYYLNNFAQANQAFTLFLKSDKRCGDCLVKIMYGHLQLREFKNAVDSYEYFRSQNADTTQVPAYFKEISYLGLKDTIKAQHLFLLLDKGLIEIDHVEKLLKGLNEGN